MEKYFKTVVVLFSALFALTNAVDNDDISNSVLVKTRQGDLEGFISKSRNQIPYNVFLGIPFGKNPGRFQVSTQFAKWDGVRSAKEYGSNCPQIGLLETSAPTFKGEEDCLFLNIYTPTITNGAGLPILFWIHGGAFSAWSGDGYDGKYFVDENVIVVTINYRLGPLGFLTFGDDEIPGNLGLKDQLLALKWVKKNIDSFGGDPNKVTIGGFSAGGASAHYHILSHQSKGLFRAAISHSGTATAFWARQENPRELAVKLASTLGCPVPETEFSSTKDTAACLKSKSAKEVVTAQVKLKEWFSYPVGLFTPVTEPEGPNSFIVQTPEAILQSGNFNKVNWITGMTEDEGAFFDIPIITDTNLTNQIETDWYTVAPVILGYQHLPLAERDAISSELRESYFDHFEIDEFTWQSLRKLFTDRYWLEPLETSVRLQSKYSRVFPYVFRFSGDYSIVHGLFEVSGDHGICHCDDLQYLFPEGAIGGPDYNDNQPAQLVEFSRKFVKLWSSFIHEMKPSATWEKQKIWKSMFLPKLTSPTTYYEIAIETGIWDEDVTTRLQTLKHSIPADVSDKSRKKTEL
ncbi:unnamed protein product [Orchesella dallaii]|uniref:Carboxylic ester hydrolase n=1 Tax=Orchesella dallaii TaxID=48710 RepID=A0ABP1PZ07_9HEXA